MYNWRPFHLAVFLFIAFSPDIQMEKGSWWSASNNVLVKCCVVTYLIQWSLIITCIQREEIYWSFASSLSAVLHLQQNYHHTLQPSRTNTHTFTDPTLTLILIDVALSIWVTYQRYPVKRLAFMSEEKWWHKTWKISTIARRFTFSDMTTFKYNLKAVVTLTC